MRKPEIDFALIDAKDGEVIGMTTTYYSGPQTKENYMVIHQAMIEYLNELDSLQKRIKEKFEPLLTPEDGKPLSDWKEIWDWEEEAEKTFGKHKSRLYYT